LDGSGSYDPDGSITKYAWVQMSGAGGVTIVNSNTDNPTVYGLQTGVYTFQLTVTDNSGVTASATVTITVSAGGKLTATHVVSRTDSDANDIVLTLLFDPEHALDERIAMEQFAT